MIRRFSATRRSSSGFTLIELLVVVVILAILAGVVVFSVRGVSDKGQSAAFAIDARTVRTAEQAYFAQPRADGQPPRFATMGELVAARLLTAPSSYHEVELSPDGSSYVLTCDAAREGCGAGGAVARGGTLVLGMSAVYPPTTNPATTANGGDHDYWGTMYNGLIDLDLNGNPVPELAVEVPTAANGGIVDGGKTYLLRLRQDVYWHDSGVVQPSNPTGAEQRFTGRDVKFTFEKVALRFLSATGGMIPFLASWDATNYVASIDVGPCSPTTTPCPGGGTLPDEYTVRFRFAEPYAPLLYQLNVRAAAMNPSHAYTGTPTQAQLQANKVGTGPFMCQYPYTTPVACRSSNGSPDGMLVRNPHYWEPGLPYADRIVMRTLTNETTRRDALLTGEVDYIPAPAQYVNSLRSDPDVAVESSAATGGGQNGMEMFIFNLNKRGDRRGQLGGPDPTGTPDPHPVLGRHPSGNLVRKAVWEAVNRTNYVAVGQSGVGVVPTAPIASRLPQHATDITLPAYDPAQARADLTAAGWVLPGGDPTAIRVWTGAQTPVGCGASDVGKCLNPGDPLDIPFIVPSTGFTARANLIASDLRAVGINMVVETITDGSGPTRTYINRDFNTYIVGLAQGYDPQIGVRRAYHSDQYRNVSASNGAGYKNAFVDQMLDEGARTVDPALRFQKYHAFQQQVAADLPYIWLTETVTVMAWRSDCHGFKVWSGRPAAAAWCAR